MNYGSPFSALFCRAVKAIARGLSAAQLVVKHIHRTAPRLWGNVDPAAASTLVEADFTAPFMHVWTNTRLNIWSGGKLCVAALSCLNRCLFLSIIVRVTHSQRGQVKVAVWYACLPRGERKRRRTRDWLGSDPPLCSEGEPLCCPDESLFPVLWAIFTWHRWVFVTDTMSFHHN